VTALRQVANATLISDNLTLENRTENEYMFTYVFGPEKARMFSRTLRLPKYEAIKFAPTAITHLNSFINFLLGEEAKYFQK
jgi:hypothetical protein